MHFKLIVLAASLKIDYRMAKVEGGRLYRKLQSYPRHKMAV